MASKLQVVSKNTAPNWIITCERDGEPINLSGCTVVVNIADDGGNITKSGGTCTITDSTNGVVSYTPTATDCPTEGTYLVDVKITYSDLSYEVLYEQLKVKTRDPLV